MAEEQSVNIGVVNPEAMIIEDDDGSVVIDFQPVAMSHRRFPLVPTLLSSWTRLASTCWLMNLSPPSRRTKHHAGSGRHLHRWTGPTWR